jgi:aminopeptidase N
VSLRRGALAAWLMLLAACAAPAPRGLRDDTGRPFDLLHYDVRVEPDIAARTLRGEATLRLRALQDLASVALDNDGLVVDAVESDGTALRFAQEARRLDVRLAQPLRRGRTLAITLRYHGMPRFGLQFHPAREQAYTIFSTSQWLPGVDSPGDRASLDLRVALPRGLVAVGNGELVARTPLDAAREQFHWRQRRPIPGYVMGFAAGRFREVENRSGRVALRLLVEGYDADELRRVFAETGDMLRYFERRAGVAYPDRRYTQALVEKTIGQELSGFSLLSDDYARRVLADPTATGLLAHEAAHQWWGNEVTCREWTHFWLNEGLVTFMAASWQEQRYGADAYLRQVDAWRARHAALVAAGHDKPLVFPEWTAPSGDDRAVVYQKGALALHELRQQLGEAAFWRGIALYTKTHFGQSVDTTDFQAAMERASGTDLGAFFARWAYGTAAPR